MSPIRPTQVAHVFYRTLRFEQMLRWYETVFRAKVLSKGTALAFLTFDDEHHRFAMLNLAAVQPEGAAPPPVQPRSLVGVDHIAYIAGTPVAELLRRETAEPMSPIRGELAAYA